MQNEPAHHLKTNFPPSHPQQNHSSEPNMDNLVQLSMLLLYTLNFSFISLNDTRFPMHFHINYLIFSTAGFLPNPSLLLCPARPEGC